MRAGRPISSLTGVVLAGGRGERYGSPKASMEFRGAPLLPQIIAALRSICSEVVIVMRQADDTSHRIVAPDVKIARDHVDDEGPLMGLASALTGYRDGSFVVVGCDMPLLNPRLLAYQASLLAGFDAVVPLVSGIPQPLHSVYDIRVKQPVANLLDNGNRSLQSLIAAVNCRFVGPDEWAEFTPDGRSFLSVNTPQELRHAEVLATKSNQSP